MCCNEASAMAACKYVNVVDIHQVASVVRNNIDTVLIIDSRSFLEYNTSHITGAINLSCSKIVKRRLQQDKLTIKELLLNSCQCEVDENSDIVVYDQNAQDADSVPNDSFLCVLLSKLLPVFRSINLVKGGFLEFHASYPNLCEDKTRKCVPLTSLSQPCLPIANQGPTRILPFLYLGSQHDAFNQGLLKDYNITHELNVSTTCPKPEFIPGAQFMRIPVIDNYSEKLLPYFPKAFNFLDKVREGSGCVLIHCLAGISRSATVAIAYVMKHLHLTSDDAYRYVKSKRAIISPNFNFLGQLLEYEKQLRREKVLDDNGGSETAPATCSSSQKKRVCRTDMRNRSLTLDIPKCGETSPSTLSVSTASSTGGSQSPTTALAKLSFKSDESPENKLESDPFAFDRQMTRKELFESEISDLKMESGMREMKDTFFRTKKCSAFDLPLRSLKGPSALSELATIPCKASSEYVLSKSSVFRKHTFFESVSQEMSAEWKSERRSSSILVDVIDESLEETASTSNTTESDNSDSPSMVDCFVKERNKDPPKELWNPCKDFFAVDHSKLPLTISEEQKFEEFYVDSPISPSEKHFLEDVVDDSVLKGEDISGFNSKGKSHWPGESELESSHDSGILSSMSTYASHDSNEWASTSSSFHKDMKYELPVSKVSDSPSVATETGGSINDWYYSMISGTSFSSAQSAKKDKICEPFKSDGLYRVQSCPGKLGALHRTSSLDGAAMASAFFNLDSHSGKQSTNVSATEKLLKYKNRYSCGSLDSCFDIQNWLGGNSGVNSTATTLRRNLSMIQVS